MKMSAKSLVKDAVHVENLPYGALIINTDGIVKEANEKATSLWKQPLINQPWNDLIEEDSISKVLQQRKVLHRIEQITKNKKKLFTTYSPLLDEQKRTIGVLLLCENFENYVGNLTAHADLFSMEEIFTVLANHVDFAASFQLIEQLQPIHNTNWTQLIHSFEIEDRKKIEAKVKHVQSITFQDRRVVSESIRIGQWEQEIKISSTPAFIRGRLIGCLMMMQNLSEIKKEAQKLEQAKRLIRNLEKTFTFEDFIGQSFEIKMAKEHGKLYAKTNAPLFIEGETGTGKRMLAHIIHFASNRSKHPFRHIRNDGQNVKKLEELLFGNQQQKGIIETVKNGTLFIEEITAIPINIQLQLVELFQNNKYNIRLIVSTSRKDIRQKLDSKFAEMFLRFPIHLPSLKKRREDLTLLVNHFITQNNLKYGMNIKTADENVFDYFYTYDWPKNVSELKYWMDIAFTHADSLTEVLTLDHFRSFIVNKQKDISIDDSLPLQSAMDLFEKKYILQMLEKCKYNKTQTAKSLGISVRNLYYKMDKYQINRESS